LFILGMYVFFWKIKINNYPKKISIVALKRV